MLNILDIIATINIILYNESTPYENWAADINGDIIVDILDIILLVNIILNN